MSLEIEPFQVRQVLVGIFAVVKGASEDVSILEIAI
jgi:hypothetical protein